MAAILQNGDIYYTKVYFTCGNQLAVCTRHWRMSDNVGVLNDQDFLNHIIGMAAWPTNWKACVSDDATYQGTQIGRVWPKPPTVPDHTIVGAGAGAVTGEVLPKQVSGIIKYQTDFAGPKYRGRNYIPFPGESANESPSGTPTTAYVTLLDTLAGMLAAPMNLAPGGGNTMTASAVILHPGEPPTYDFIREAFGSTKWATQKRRGDYGQPNQLPF